MLPQGVSVPRDDSATAPLPTRTGATWCAAEEGTTHTSTPRCGNATANSTGAALSSATRVASGQRCSPANNGIECKQSELPRVRKVEYNKQRQHHFAHLILLRKRTPANTTTTTPSLLLLMLLRMVHFGWLAVVTALETRATGLRWCWQPRETFSISLSPFFFFILNFLNYNLGVVEFS